MNDSQRLIETIQLDKCSFGDKTTRMKGKASTELREVAIVIINNVLVVVN